MTRQPLINDGLPTVAEQQQAAMGEWDSVAYEFHQIEDELDRIAAREEVDEQ